MPKQQYVFQIKYPQAIILSNSTRKLLPLRDGVSTDRRIGSQLVIRQHVLTLRVPLIHVRNFSALFGITIHDLTSPRATGGFKGGGGNGAMPPKMPEVTSDQRRTEGDSRLRGRREPLQQATDIAHRAGPSAVAELLVRQSVVSDVSASADHSSVIFSSCVWNESVPIQLAQCCFHELAISNARILIHFSDKIYGSNFIKQRSETVIV